MKKQQFVSPSRQPGVTSPAISPSASLETGSTASDTLSGVSVNSTYRHHQAGPFMPSPTPSQQQQPQRGPATAPQPVLVKDRQHKPKTLGSFGLLVVGLGGANGTTLLAGVLAHRLNIDWHGPRGEPNSPNYYGCITQLDQRGKYGGVGYRNKVKGLANASMAAIGGWVRTSFSRRLSERKSFSRHLFLVSSCRRASTLYLTLSIRNRIFDPPNRVMLSCSNRS